MTPDVLVVGAGIIGSACAAALTAAGLRVTVVDQAGPVSGTTGAGEGNVLVSDKPQGPELDLALRSLGLWAEIVSELGAGTIEAELKGGIVVVQTPAAYDALARFAAQQRSAGVEAELLSPHQVAELEPHLTPDIGGGVHYPQDMQVHPALAAAHLLRAAVARGASVTLGVEVRGLAVRHGRVRGVRTDAGLIGADVVINATGPLAGEVSRRFGTPIPILPRRGFVLVTEPLPPMVRHKVYTADYVANVGSSDADLEVSTVVEGTASGPILIGASRERVGLDHRLSVEAVRRLARGAVELFPFLAGVDAIRAYHGFRPFSPDHLPVIGADPRVGGLVHACGHEGAGIGLAPATAELVTQLVSGTSPTLDPAPFRVERLLEAP